MLDHQTWLLFIKKLTGDCTLRDLAELNDRLSANPLLHQHLASIEQIWNDRKFRNPTCQLEVDKEYERLLAKLNLPSMNEAGAVVLQESGISVSKQSKVSLRKVYTWAMAVAAVFIVGAWATGWFRNNAETKSSSAPSPLIKNNEVATRAGSRSQLKLPDGTQVWLNGDSKLSYADDFGNKSREVHLTGEAYFDVTADKNRPFFIQTETIRIKVTGTAFNVRSYPNEAISETSLIHGKVEVTVNENPGKIYQLLPSEKLIVANHSSLASTKVEQALHLEKLDYAPLKTGNISVQKLMLKELNDRPVETAWVNNKLVFSDESFRQVANKMEHWFGVKVKFEDPSLEGIYFTGSFENESLSDALEAMQYTAKFRFHIRPGYVTIYE
jgi:ferric-dicitrate binding protein FerR (iron transport regulator)